MRSNDTVLARNLFRAGRGARLRSASSRGRFIAMASATAVLALTCLILAASYAVYAERAIHDGARFPMGAASKSDTNVLWTAGFDTLSDHLQHSVVLIEPVAKDAPLPPGLDRWPDPGQVFISPQLVRDGQKEGIEFRYGHMVGQIAASGLSVPDERLAYVRPLAGHMPPNAQLVAGFGLPPVPAWQATTNVIFGETLQILGLEVFLPLVAGFALLPALVLLYVAGGVGAEERARRDLLLESLGATPWARRWMRLGDVLAPLLSGLALACVAAGTLLVTGLRIPVTRFVLPTTHLWGQVWLLTGAVAVAALIALASTVLPAHRRARSATRPARSRAKLSPWVVLSCPVALFLAVRLPSFVDPAQGELWGVVYKGGVALTLITLPLSLAVVASLLGHGLRTHGRRRGSPGAVVAGSWMSASPKVVVRSSAGVVLGVCVILQAQLWVSQNGENARRAMADQAVLEGRVAQMKIPDTVSLGPFLKGLPTGTSAALLSQPVDQADAKVQGSCATLTQLALPCEAQATMSEVNHRAQVLWVNVTMAPKIDTHVIAEVAPVRGQENLLLLSGGGRDSIDLPRLKQLSYRTVPGTPVVELAGDNWLTGAQSRANQGLWILIFGFVAIVIVALTLALDAAAQFRRHSASLAPLATLTGERRVFWAVSGWTVLTPMLLGAWASVVVSVALSDPLTRTANLELSNVLLLGVPLTLSLLAIATWAIVSRAASSSALSWRPRAE